MARLGRGMTVHERVVGGFDFAAAVEHHRYRQRAHTDSERFDSTGAAKCTVHERELGSLLDLRRF